MQILIRTIGTKINNENRSYLRKKILKYELLVSNSSVVECSFEQKRGPRRDGNKIVHLKAKLPGIKKQIFVKSPAEPDFNVAIDRAEAKFNRVVRKQLEIQKHGGKRAKYYWSKVKSAPSLAIKRLRFKKNR
jgi:ribosome-associated translation inhibitor RaiA